eukprot:GEMP01031106.1.p1 GENE.GEMP01031106.1~~GEMP01031106.1.p1  ORF type:complete len:480 (+),score=108.74 GEMP01031106.1:80-1519(+)
MEQLVLEQLAQPKRSSGAQVQVTLDQWDSHLDCAITEDGLEASCLHTDGFQFLWKGARATHGIIGGCYMFEVKIVEMHKVDMPGTSARNQNIVRVGCSLAFTSLFLGDSLESWGWGGTGKKCNDGEFTDFGEGYGVNDVIGVIMDADNLTVSFLKNGKFIGMAFKDIDESVQVDGLFPHVLLKNVRVELNFDRECAWFQPPKNIYFLQDANEFVLIENPIDHPNHVDDAEFVMMVGLPACGKTTWALKYMDRHPRRGYTLLGTTTVIDQMKVVGMDSRKGNFGERWQQLVAQATPLFQKLCAIAGKSIRNIILDQTNVFAEARERKIADYLEYGERRAIVIVNDTDTLERRSNQRECEEGKVVPKEVVLGMKAVFTKPELSEGFTAIDYIEASEDEAESMIKDFNEEGKEHKERFLVNVIAIKARTPVAKEDSSDSDEDSCASTQRAASGSRSPSHDKKKRSRSPARDKKAMKSRSKRR